MPYTGSTPALPIEAGNTRVSSVGGYANQAQISSIYDRPPVERLELFARHGRQINFSLLLDVFGWKQGSSNASIGHYEEPMRNYSVKLGTVQTAASGAGATQVSNVHADSIFQTNSTVNGTANQASFPQVGDTFQLPTGEQVYVTAKTVTASTHRVTLKPVKAAVNLATVTTENTTAIWIGKYHAEGSGLPGTRLSRVFKYGNSFAILKSAFGTTGSELTNRVIFEVVPGADPNTTSVVARIKAEMLIDHEVQRSRALLLGQTFDNRIDFVTEMGVDASVPGTEGFYTFAAASGTSDTYTEGSFAIEDFDSLSLTYIDQRVGTNLICGWVGPNLMMDMEKAFTNFVSTDVDSLVEMVMPGFSGVNLTVPGSVDSIQGNVRNKALTIGFKGITKLGMAYLLKNFDDFSDITGAGASTFPYRKRGLFHPTGQAQDTMTARMMPLIGYEYKAMGNVSRDNVIASFQGVGVAGSGGGYTIASHGGDLTNTGIVSEIAFHASCGNKLIVLSPA